MSEIESCLQQFFIEINPQEWDAVQNRLPERVRDNKNLYAYYVIQVINKKDPEKAKGLSKCLDDIDGFLEFEEEHGNYCATIDIAVNGQTRREIRP
jgi:hypothetical protein